MEIRSTLGNLQGGRGGAFHPNQNVELIMLSIRVEWLKSQWEGNHSPHDDGIKAVRGLTSAKTLAVQDLVGF